MQQHLPRETPSPMPERVPAQGPGEWRTFLSVAFCCGELEFFEENIACHGCIAYTVF